MWREQNEKNYIRSLDHQTASLRNSDAKWLKTKTLLHHVETLFDERQQKWDTFVFFYKISSFKINIMLESKVPSMEELLSFLETFLIFDKRWAWFSFLFTWKVFLQTFFSVYLLRKRRTSLFSREECDILNFRSIDGQCEDVGPHLILKYPEDRSILDDASDLIIHYVKRQANIQKDEKRIVKRIMRK